MDEVTHEAATSTAADRYCRSFYLLHETGDRLYPVRMEDRDTGRKAFRVSPGGNTKRDSIEVESEAELRRCVFVEGFAVRAATLTGTRTGLYRLGETSIRWAVTGGLGQAV